MRSTLGFIFLMLIIGSANATNFNWRWFYAGLGAFQNNTEVFYRAGVAKVSISSNQIKIEFRENDLPELTPYFKGKIVNNFSINGSIEKMFPSEDKGLSYEGSYKITNWGSSCKEHEILLTPKVRNGHVLMIMKTEGNCQFK